MTGLVIGAIIISFSSIMVKLADVPPDVVGFYRVFVGGLGMLAMLWASGKIHCMTRRVWKWSLLTGFFFALDLIVWHRSIDFIGPGLATMLGNFQVIVLAVVSILFFKEKVSHRFLVAIPTALIGLYLMVGVSWSTFTSEYQTGVFFGLLTALAYALYLLSLKVSLSKADADPLAMASGAALISGLLLAGFSLGQGESFAIPNTRSLLALGVLSLGCHAFGWFLITRSIQQVRTSLVGLILLLQPTLSYVWDILLFDKPTSVVELSGVGLALVAIYLGSIKSEA